MKQIASLREELTASVFAHEVIQRNPYTKWFKRGEANTEQVIDLVVQFSVFSNHFIPLEAKRMVNAATEEAEKEARAILGSGIACLEPRVNVPAVAEAVHLMRDRMLPLFAERTGAQ